jgi:succinoglycan biosynthesis protein ExoA
MTRVSVIVPCRNEKKHIRPFLESLLSQVAPPDLAYEFLISDGMSDDGTREILAEYRSRFDNLEIVDNPKQIVSTAMNEAIAKAQGEIVVRMDVHSEYAPDYLAQCVSALNTTGAGNVGGPAIAVGESYMQRAISLAYQSPFGCGGARFHDPNFEGYVDTVPYGCWKKTTLESLGLFDEALVRNQDDELNLRLILSGGKIWQTPRIRSYYRPRASLKALARQYAQYGYWKVFVIRKHRVTASWRHLVPAIFVLTLAVLILAALFSKIGLVLLSGVLGLYLAAAIVATILAAKRPADRSRMAVLPVVFLAYHCSYGAGFLRGIADLLFDRAPAQSLSAIVR